MNEKPRRFAELGYCLFPAVFDAAEVESHRRLLDEYTEDDRLDRPNYLGEPHASDERWLAICTHPRLLQAIEAILGPNLILVFSSVFSNHQERGEARFPGIRTMSTRPACTEPTW